MNPDLQAAPWSAANDELLARALRCGKSCRQIAKETGWTVDQQRERIPLLVEGKLLAPAPNRGRRWDEQERQLVEHMLLSGCPVDQLAQLVGRTACAVVLMLEQRGYNRDHLTTYGAACPDGGAAWTS